MGAHGPGGPLGPLGAIGGPSARRLAGQLVRLASWSGRLVQPAGWPAGWPTGTASQLAPACGPMGPRVVFLKFGALPSGSAKGPPVFLVNVRILHMNPNGF